MQINQVGLKAIPIICLLNFLVGIVLTHQGINTLEEFGQLDKIPHVITPVYVRYVGSLISSLLVAGRSGSAFASEIGSMILNQEIDALQAVGINTQALIVIPRIIATSFMLPVLVVLAIISGIAGSIFFANQLIDFPVQTFIYTVRDLIKLKHGFTHTFEELYFRIAHKFYRMF